MQKLEKIRNIGIIAHIDAGKTTTTERILFYTGVNYKIGEVHDGEATMDWMVQEKERGITITSAATKCHWNGTKNNLDMDINLIDTPGHVDFTAEVERSLRVLDGAICILDGGNGFEPQTETVNRQADKYKVPRIFFINKMDKIGANFKMNIESIHSKFSKSAIPIQLPIGEEKDFMGIIDIIERKAYTFEGKMGEIVKEIPIPQNMIDDVENARMELIEKIAEFDDVMTEKFINGEDFTVDEIKRAIRKATISGTFYPVLCGSALTNKGIQLLLDAVWDYLPSPLDIPSIVGKDYNGNEITRKADDNEPLTALIFKIATDPFVGTLSFVRVYSGVLRAGTYVYNANSRKKERVGRLVQLHANSKKEVSEITAGNIGAIVALKDTKTGDTICEEGKEILLESIEFAEPVISLSIEPKTKADQEKMGIALGKLASEDPTFKVSTNTETGQTVISGMGELHLEIMVDRLKREFGVEVNVGKPQVAYRETILTSVEAEGKFIKQTGGRGQYGHVWLRLEPLERGAGVQFKDEIVGGVIPKEYIPAIEKGVKETTAAGVIAGFPLVDIKVTLFDGSYHEVDSSELAFKIATALAIKDGVKRAKGILLEPIMKVEVVTPEEFMGDIMGDLNSRRGQIYEMGDRGNAKVILAKVPLSEMFGYVTQLRSISQGRAVYSMELLEYAQLPNNLMEAIIKERGVKD